jgi:ribosomal protein S18 acetylase RimI-like enzyme
MTDLCFKLEELLFNSWVALQTEHVDGFLLRYALGHTKRSNSASSLYPSSMPFPEISQLVRDRYKQAGIKPMFRITPLSPSGLDAHLEREGWVHHDPSQTMVLDIPQRLVKASERESIITIEEMPTPAWIEGAGEAYGFVDWQIEALAMICSNIRLPSAYCTVYLDKKPVGYGLAVFERGAMGLYDLAILPELRGKGLGRRMVLSLVHWGKSRGAEMAYLQVRRANEKAIGLYENMGFKLAYHYHHRVWEGKKG